MSPVAAPTLETERLILRARRADDLEHSHALWCDPTVYKFIAGKPSTREDVWRGILRDIGQWQIVGFGFWVVEEKASGIYIGEMGYLDCKRDVIPAMDETPEVGWVLGTAYHGKGYATEAMTAIQSWGDANLAPKTTSCIISPENTPSLRLAKKLGFKDPALTNYKGEPTIMMQRNAASGN